MDKKEKLVYETIADKTLDFGTRIQIDKTDNNTVRFITTTDEGGPGITDSIDGEFGYYYYDGDDDMSLKFNCVGDIEESDDLLEGIFKGKYFKILPKPIHFGYAIDWLEKEEKRMIEEEFNPYYDWGCREKWKLIQLWEDKTLSIEHKVNIEALDFIYNLIEQGK